MRNHDRIHTSFNGLTKGRQFDGLQARHSPVTCATLRCESVAVSPCPGKCLTVVSIPVGARAANVSRNEVAHLLRIFSERAGIDDGICGIGIHIGIGKEIPMHSDGAGFLGADAAEGFGVIEFSGRAK